MLSSIPFANIGFIFKFVSETYDSAASFKGVYSSDAVDDSITVSFMFSGLGLPKGRIDALKVDAQKNMDALMAKKNSAPGKMSIDLGQSKTGSAADSMMDKIKKNKSAVGKLLGTGTPKKSVIDRRR